MKETGLGVLKKDNWGAGGGATPTAGPVGRTAAASTDALLKAEIISYSRSKGLFAGLEIKGTVIKPDDDENVAVYALKGKDILSPTQAWTMTKMPAGVRIFPRTLARYSVRK